MNELIAPGHTPTRADVQNAPADIRRQARREILVICLATLAVVAAGILGLWLSSTNSIRENFRDHLVSVARAAASQVDPTLHDALRRPEQRNGPEYRRAVEPLRRLRAAEPEIHFIYSVVADGDAVRFVLDAADPGLRDPGGVEQQSGLWEQYDERDPAMLAALGRPGRAGRAAATDRPYGDKWGLFMTGWAPLWDAAGRQIGAVGVDVDASAYVARLADARRWAFIGLAPAGALIALLGAGFFRVRVRGLVAMRAAIASADALAEERQRLSAVIEGTGVGTWELDLVTTAMSVNPRWRAMLGRGPGESEAVDRALCGTLIHPEDLKGAGQAMAAALASPDGLLEAEFRMRHAAGHWVWILAHGKVLERDAQGQPRRMAGIHLDLSAHKKAELSLRESEFKFRSLFDLSPVGIALNDFATGQFLQVNDALVGPTGYTREELLQMTYWDITPAKYQVDETAQIQAMQHTDRYGPYEKEYVRKDGSTYTVLLSGIRLIDAAGRAVIWSLVQDISQRKSVESALALAARQDKLTGLASRMLFMERLQQAVERVHAGRQRYFAVLFLDFDRFKLINDTLGHEAGDELLRKIAGRLCRSLRAVDTLNGEAGGNVVGRFGGDEFLILINDLKAPDDALVIAERLLNTLTAAYEILGSEVHSTASLGIVTSEQCRTSAEDVVRNADVAMFEAKRSGPGCSAVFNEAMHTRLSRHVAIENSLRKAIGSDEISVVYQPIVDLATGRMVSAEALVRWKHPTLGAMSPAEFIPIAEETGLIVALGTWVLQRACRDFVTWRQRDPERAPRTVSVNVSRAELALGRRLLEQVRSTLASAGLPPTCLQLEVTEREVMRNPEASLKLMHELRDLGVRLAMDDFGTGTSSLGFLRDYPFDTIKIDRSFVTNLTNNGDVLAVIHATINLIENLGMISLTEGIEEAAQVAVLQSLGCRQGQGYLFSRPVPAAQLLEAIAARPAAVAETAGP